MSDRVETGPICFGEDWPGVFIRGDNALHLRYQLTILYAMLHKYEDEGSLPTELAAAFNMNRVNFNWLFDAIDSCMVGSEGYSEGAVQHIKDFKECEK